MEWIRKILICSLCLANSQRPARALMLTKKAAQKAPIGTKLALAVTFLQGWISPRASVRKGFVCLSDDLLTSNVIFTTLRGDETGSVCSAA